MTNIPYEALGPELHSDPEVMIALLGRWAR